MLEGACHCGAVRWTFEGDPGSATACNCTVCRRYGVLWIYDYEGERVAVTGQTTAYTRSVASSPPEIAFNFCATCGCVVSWRALAVDAEGRRRLAVNVRLAEPGAVAHLPIDHFDGLDRFEDLPRDGRTVHDMWF
jgi:hypothetical protein